MFDRTALQEGRTAVENVVFNVTQQPHNCCLSVLREEKSLENLKALLNRGPETNFRFPMHEAVPIFQALLVISDGPAFALTPSDTDQGGFITDVVEKWRCEYSSDLADYSAGSTRLTVCQTRIGDGNDCIYLPIPCEAGGDMEGFSDVLLGFIVPQGALWRAKDSFLHNKLPLILDLDETLVNSHTQKTLSNKLKEASAQRRRIESELQKPISESERYLHKASLKRLKAEEKALGEDSRSLSEFVNTDAVTFGGEKWMAKIEPVHGDSEITSRPVIRVPEAGIFFTRIDGRRLETSMLVRTRPGWEELKAAILGLLPSRDGQASKPRPRFDVFVCTASERRYAEEVWRLLDTEHHIIPSQEFAHVPGRPPRIVCVDPMRKKTLEGALSIGGGIRVPMLLAIIADDRLDVWEADARKQILDVQPFMPHQRAKDIYDELVRDGKHGVLIPWLSLAPLAERLGNMWSHVFFDRDQALKLRELHDVESRTLVWPRVRSISELNQVIELPKIPSLPEGKPDIVVRLPATQKKRTCRQTFESVYPSLESGGPSLEHGLSPSGTASTEASPATSFANSQEVTSSASRRKRKLGKGQNRPPKEHAKRKKQKREKRRKHEGQQLASQGTEEASFKNWLDVKTDAEHKPNKPPAHPKFQHRMPGGGRGGRGAWRGGRPGSGGPGRSHGAGGSWKANKLNRPAQGFQPAAERPQHRAASTTSSGEGSLGSKKAKKWRHGGGIKKPGGGRHGGGRGKG